MYDLFLMTALGQVFLRLIAFSPAITTSGMLHTIFFTLMLLLSEEQAAAAWERSSNALLSRMSRVSIANRSTFTRVVL
jgi:hypothetical protein